MGAETWAEVDRYFTECLGLADPALDAALAESAAAGLPTISVSAPQGKLLNLKGFDGFALAVVVSTEAGG